MYGPPPPNGPNPANSYPPAGPMQTPAPQPVQMYGPPGNAVYGAAPLNHYGAPPPQQYQPSPQNSQYPQYAPIGPQQPMAGNMYGVPPPQQQHSPQPRMNNNGMSSQQDNFNGNNYGQGGYAGKRNRNRY